MATEGKKTKLNAFKCINDCFYGNRRWSPTDKRLMYSDKKEVPHFKNMSVMNDLEKEGLDEGNRLDRIKAFLISMDRENDEMWTQDGLPAVKVVEENTKLDTSRGEITRAFLGFTRDSEVGTMAKTQPDFMQ